MTLLRAYDAVFRHQTKHRVPRIINPGADYLAEIVAYLWKGIVKAPDSMSASTKMATETKLLQHALQHGYASMSPKHLLENGYEALLHPPADSDDSEIGKDIGEDVGEDTNKGEDSSNVPQRSAHREFTPIPSESDPSTPVESESISSEEETFLSSDIEEEPVPTLPPILQYSKQICPGGQRFKQSHLFGVPKPQRLVQERWTETACPANQTTNQTPLTPPPSSGPVGHASSPEQPLLQSLVWTQADQKFLDNICSNLFPWWCWSQFPKAYMRTPEQHGSINLRRRPLTKITFHHLAAEDVELKERIRNDTGFKNVFDRLFPAGFKIPATQMNA